MSGWEKKKILEKLILNDDFMTMWYICVQTTNNTENHGDTKWKTGTMSEKNIYKRDGEKRTLERASDFARCRLKIDLSEIRGRCDYIALWANFLGTLQKQKHKRTETRSQNDFFARPVLRKIIENKK